MSALIFTAPLLLLPASEIDLAIAAAKTALAAAFHVALLAPTKPVVTFVLISVCSANEGRAVG